MKNLSYNKMVLVSVTNTVGAYSQTEISIRGKINFHGDPYSRSILKGQEVIIFARNMNKVYHARYKATRNRKHIFEKIECVRLHSSIKLVDTYNGFKKIECEFMTLGQSLHNVIAKINGNAQPIETETKPAEQPSIIAKLKEVNAGFCPIVIRTTIKNAYCALKAMLPDDKILPHLDEMLGHYLTLPINPSLTDTPLSFYSDSITPKVDYGKLKIEICEQLKEEVLFDFKYHYERAIKFESCTEKEAMLLAADFVRDLSFKMWLEKQLSPVKKTATTLELIRAICLDDFDWLCSSKKAA